jgi:hypothetical protein
MERMNLDGTSVAVGMVAGLALGGVSGYLLYRHLDRTRCEERIEAEVQATRDFYKARTGRAPWELANPRTSVVLQPTSTRKYRTVPRIMTKTMTWIRSQYSRTMKRMKTRMAGLLLTVTVLSLMSFPSSSSRTGQPAMDGNS